jgi:RNA polymerase sigma-70 factor (ECF subfamily)
MEVDVSAVLVARPSDPTVLGVDGARRLGVVPDAQTRTEELLVAVGRGDRLAFEVLYRRIIGRVIGQAQRVIRDPSLAEEVAQEVLAEVWRKAATFDPDRGSAQGWIATMTRRRAVDRVRSEQAGRDRDVRVAARAVLPAVDVVSEEVETRLAHDEVRRALDALSALQREAVRLAYFEGHTYRDVARVLGIPEGTAKSRLRDALVRLRGALDGQG